MLSQLSKTIKLALKSTQEERALLRARSAVQRFPVVEWRQKMEDFHRRSIGTSRNLAAENAFRESDCIESVPPRPIGVDHDDWEPENQPEPTQPEWDAQSVRAGANSSQLLSPNSPYGQTPRPGSSGSFSSVASPNDRGGDPDYFSHPVEAGPEPGTPGTPGADDPGFSNFLSKANRQIAKEQKHVPDPFLDEQAMINRPFMHHRVSSVESISSIMDEKGSTSPLNKAIASVGIFCT